MGTTKNYQQEVICKKSNRKIIFDVDLERVDMLGLENLNGIYKGKEERLKATGGNVVDSFLNIAGLMVLDFMTKPPASGESISEKVMSRLLINGNLEPKWPPLDGSKGIKLIYLGTADKDTESILIEASSKVYKDIREDFISVFEKSFMDLKKNAEYDKLVVAPVRVDEEGEVLMVKIGFDLKKLTCEKLLRVFDTTPEEVLSSVLQHTGGGNDTLATNPVDLLLVTLSRVVEVLVVHGEREPWVFLEKTPPWGWPAFDEEFGLRVFEFRSNLENNVLPKVTPKNFNHLLKASLGLAEPVTSNQ